MNARSLAARRLASVVLTLGVLAVAQSAFGQSFGVELFNTLMVENPERVVKGGSFLCNVNYCESYRPTARRGIPPDTGSGHVGFRCVMSPATPSAGSSTASGSK